MSNREKQDGLPDIYLSPSYHPGEGHRVHISSDTEPNVWEDTDSESWTALVPVVTLNSASNATSNLGLREEIEGGSSLDIPVAGISQENETENSKGGTPEVEAVVRQPDNCENKILLGRGRNQIPKQRGETPGSDCPPVAGITAFVRRLGQPLNLDTQTQMARSSELIFSPGGDQGFIVPGGVHAYYGSGSDTETLEWADGEGPTLVPIRDAVEGADAVLSPDQAMDSSVEDLERNSPAGLSTPDAEIDMSVTSGRTLVSKKPQKSIRPPAVGQSEEVLVQASRKDLGSTDGEESEEEGRKRTQEAIASVSNSAEAHLGSLGSQSENTDSVSTVLDMRRGEVQGCERDCTSTIATASSALGGEATLPQPKPAFVVGGLISPRGKLRQFQDAVRDRMQDVKASLEMGSGSTDEPVDRQHYLNKLSLYPPLISTNEPEVSLASLVSVESTNPPESSDRVTSPSVLSVSSVASSKRMEWDSGADVGYLGTNTHVTPAASLSTLERIALGSYASVLRTEPEGTTQAKEKQRMSKKGWKLGSTKGGGQGATSRHSATEPSISSPLHSARSHQNRDKVCLSSSEEDLSNKLLSPAQSPRRRLRRRALMASPQEGDISIRRSTRVMHFMDRRLREITQERHSEGKSSSLVELATPTISSGQYRRSNSQQSLLPVAPLQARFSVNAASGVADTASWNKKGEQLVANTSTSTSTLVQSMSPLPLAGTVASTSTTTPGAFQHLSGGKEEHKFVTGDSRCSSMSSLTTHDREYLQTLHAKPSWTSSGNDISSRSEASSPAWLPSHTDTESLTSHALSTDEPGDLKARKNSENAKNHENIVRRGSSGEVEGEGLQVDSSSSSPGCTAAPHIIAPDAESTLESQVSLQSFNNALHALSVKLQEHIQALLDSGSLRKVQDYNKLQDYVRFVGIPSVTEEECRLRQGVAGVITRMFGEIAFDHPHVTTDTSNTFTSETSDSHAGDQHLPTPGTCEDLDVPIPWDESGGEKDEQEHDGTKGQQGSEQKQEHQSCTRKQEQQVDGEEQEKANAEQDRCTTPGGSVVVVPYRPPSASRTYFMAVAHEWEAGLVEGEHVPAASDVGAFRGEAEGEREKEDAVALLTPHLHHTTSDSGSSNEWVAEKLLSVEGVTLREGDEEALPRLPNDHHILGRSQGTGTPQSESSPGHSSSPLHTWPREEPSTSQWWAGGGRCERLYQDRRGGLHVAHQPPGYTDDHDDSHPSESLSDHDHHRHHHSGDAGRPPARPWTSSGSESAYETIRERHRHVDEALASSFEFYSTSPRDARLLGYVSSEGQEEEEQQRVESPTPAPSSASGNSAAQPITLSHSWQQQQQQKQHQQQQANGQNSPPSSYTDAHDVSSQISFIQLQKQKYVRKIQRHIQTLEKLERALLDQLGDNIGSEGAFKQRVTEGCFRTGSDTNGNVHTHDILGQSDTTTSSIRSSEESIGVIRKQRDSTHHLGMVSRISHPSGQESPSLSIDGKGENTRLTCEPSGTVQSHSSSPRANISQLSSDLTSSRASTMRQVEEEVRKLAAAEEQSRKVVLRPHSSPSSWASHNRHGRSLQLKEPRREEDGVQSEFNSQSAQSNTPESTASGRRKLSAAVEVSTTRRVATGSSSSELPSVRALPISEESASDLPASESQISRQGDGRETEDKNQIRKAVFATRTSSKALPLQLPPPSEVTTSEIPTVYPSDTLSKDFGQMFPSNEHIVVGSGRKGESIGVQTGDSLLYPRKSFKKRGESISASTSERESTTGSSRNKKAWSKIKQTEESNKGTDYVKQNAVKSRQRRTPEKRKPLFNRKHCAENAHKNGEVSKEKELIKRRSKAKEPKSKLAYESSINNKKYSEKLSRKLIVKDKPLPLKEHKALPKSRTEGKDELKNRNIVFTDKHGGLQDCKSSSRSTLNSGDRTISSGSSLSQSMESISQGSTEHDRILSDRAKSVRNEGRLCQHEGDSSSIECPQELENHSQQNLPNIISEDSNTNQDHQSSLRKKYYIKNDQASLEEPVQGLKGGAEDSSIKEAPKQLLISPPGQKGRSSQISRSVANYERHKIDTAGVPSKSKSEKNLTNKVNVVQHSLQVEAESVITRQGSDLAKQRQQTKQGTLKVAWVKDRESVLEKKPVRFEVKFSNQENLYPSKSDLLVTTTTTTTTTNFIQEELTHTTKEVLTLQEALARARPDYLREAGDRSALIRLKREMRQAAQTRNHNVLAQIPPNLQTPSTLQQFLYKPDLAPLFSYKDIRQQNQRLYSLLPEARAPGAKQYRAAVHRTNRLLAGLYSQRLRKKVMQGQVSHAHKEVVTPLVHRILHQQIVAEPSIAIRMADI